MLLIKESQGYDLTLPWTLKVTNNQDVKTLPDVYQHGFSKKRYLEILFGSGKRNHSHLYRLFIIVYIILLSQKHDFVFSLIISIIYLLRVMTSWSPWWPLSGVVRNVSDVQWLYRTKQIKHPITQYLRSRKCWLWFIEPKRHFRFLAIFINLRYLNQFSLLKQVPLTEPWQ